MRPTLTVASSLTPSLPWWRNVQMSSFMLPKAISMVTRNIAERAPRDGVAIVIRVPGSTRAENAEWSMTPKQRRALDAIAIRPVRILRR